MIEDKRHNNKGKVGRHWTGRPHIVINEQLPKSKDEGCAYAPSCLNCSFPICLEELSYNERQAFIKEEGLSRIKKLPQVFIKC